jgi:hypothetical protein
MLFRNKRYDAFYLVYGLMLSVGTERSNCSSHEQEVGFTLSLIPA